MSLNPKIELFLNFLFDFSSYEFAALATYFIWIASD